MSKSTHFVITLVAILCVIIVTSVCNYIGNYIMMIQFFLYMQLQFVTITSLNENIIEK
jgi:hypothetical protein